MSKKVLFAVLSALAFVSAPAHAGSDFTTPVTKDFWEDGVEWDGGLGKAYDMRFFVIYVQNRIAVCGAGQFLNATTRSATIDLLRKAKVRIDDTVILTDVTYFTKVKTGQDLMSAKATCRDTGVKAPKGGYNVYLDISGRARF